MKILYVDPMSRNNLGVYDKNLLKNIDEYELYFYCNKDFQFDSIGTVSIIRSYEYNKKKGIFKIVSYLKSQYSLYRFVKKEKISLVHFQWLKIPSLDFLLIKILKKRNIKIVLTAHNALPHDSGRKYYKIFKKIYQSLDKVIVHAKNTKNELIDEFFVQENKIEVIPHGLLENTLKTSKKELGLRKSKNELIFSLTGALNNYKGIDLLIEAWSKLNLEKKKNIRLVIAGRGEIDFSKIEKMENVTIINRFLSEEELNEVYEETDVAIFPYRKISQSGVLLSILSKRKPVLVSNIGGLTQPFEVGDVGWILEKLSVLELEKKLNIIIKNQQKIDNIKKNIVLWKKIEEYYSWKKIGKETKKIYEEVKKNI